MNTIRADASPEKRLFISLITRDISLVAAFLDLIDNSVNAAVEPHATRLKTATDYQSTFVDPSIKPSVDIRVHVDATSVRVTDDAAGIPSQIAKEHVFKFGRSSDEAHASDRLSVYGIGMKRALFKLGNNIKFVSDHTEGGFGLDLDVGEWAKDKNPVWTFPLSERIPVQQGHTGTDITITNLTAETKLRVSDAIFINQLKDAISRTYAFYLAKFVNIFVNGEMIDGKDVTIGSNIESDTFSLGGTTCAIAAGLAVPAGEQFRDKTAGWYVFCNGRAVVSADKTGLTGWGGGQLGLPSYQPKHRAFIGTVFFVSTNAEELPWNTTKSGINEDSELWQLAKRQMATVGRRVVSFLDGRYTEEGTEVTASELKEFAGSAQSVIAAAVAPKSSFQSATKPRLETIKIQYSAKVEDVRKIGEHIGRRNISGSDAGKYTFDFYLRNEVGEK